MNIAAPLSPQLLTELSAIVGESRIKTDDLSLQTWGCDYTKHFDPKPAVIVFPTSTAQVQQIVQLANTHQLAITPSGGRTGLSAGAVAANGEIVISLDKMNQVLDFFPADRMVRIQAGMVTEQLQHYAEEQGLYYPVDFASAGSSQMGGNIATNAGGIKVIKYGMTRNWVLGLTVVTGKGDILRINKGMIKNATGYALQHLFIGGEGTLGIVTEAEIKLDRQPQDLQVMVLGVPNFDAVMPILHAFQSKIDLTAFEFFGEVAMQKVLDHGHVQRPFDTECPFYVLLEFEAPYEPIMDKAMEIFEHCMEEEWVLDGVLSQSLDQVESLWRLREDISESIAPFTPYKNDISVLVTHVPAFIKDIDAIVQENYPDFEVCWFGHIGDGNLHLNILKPQDLSKDEFFAKCQVVNQHVFDTVQKYDGSISAEHGVGMTKKPYLSYTRSAEEIEYMKALKQVFDPNTVMNPGKLFDL
ncbi:FAD-binding oxidoreductase [Acinetobacter boissieri]|uniref:D-2-hydroxyglutarate dehydrogenase n=1 Tax=Acinetobacter boissieri TaxID=1219383 RepID=A0A1G6HYX4_9GAMM|nr:FAD-binding oxidoreductase [Acinetobacter boissieri]SDB99499.1 FAD/FMN-containing dehydrogenase [Acinetobacter boissieri]